MHLLRHSENKITCMFDVGEGMKKIYICENLLRNVRLWIVLIDCWYWF